MAEINKRRVFTVLGQPVGEHLHCLTCGCRFPTWQCSNWDKDPSERHRGCLVYHADRKTDRHLCPHCFKLNAQECLSEDALLEQEQLRSMMLDVQVDPEDTPSSYLQKLADRELLYVVRHLGRYVGTHLLVVVTPDGLRNTIRTYLRRDPFNTRFFEKQPDESGRVGIWLAATTAISEIMPVDLHEDSQHVDISLKIKAEHLTDIYEIDG